MKIGGVPTSRGEFRYACGDADVEALLSGRAFDLGENEFVALFLSDGAFAADVFARFWRGACCLAEG